MPYRGWDRDTTLSAELQGKKVLRVWGMEDGSTSIGIEVEDASGNSRTMLFEHIQDCCESVLVEDVVGDPSDLVGEVLLLADEVTNADDPPGWREPDWSESYTWTYYRFASRHGFVDVRWYGTSNGYYSESVDWWWTDKMEDYW